MPRCGCGPRLLALLIVVGSTLLGAPAGARPFTMADLLALRRLTSASVSPSGRVFVLGVSDPYSQAPAYGDVRRIPLTLNRLYRLDTAHPRRPRLQAFGGRGLTAGEYSPSGRHLLAYRARGARLQLEVADLLTGRAHLLAGYGESAGLGRTAAWLSETRLIFLSPRADLTAPAQNHRWHEMLWRRTQAGKRAAVTVFDSGGGAVGPAPASASLVEMDLLSRRSRRLAEGRFDDLEVSSSQRYVAITGPGEDAPRAGRGVLGFSDVAPRRHLFILDRAGRRLVEPCPDCDVAPTLMSWAPGEDRLLVFARPSSKSDWSQARPWVWSPSGMREIDLAGLEPVLGAVGSEALVRPAAAWSGGAIIAFAHRSGEARADWWRVQAGRAVNLTASMADPPASLLEADRQGVVISSKGETLRIAVAGGPPRPLAIFESVAPSPLGSGLRHALTPADHLVRTASTIPSPPSGAATLAKSLGGLVFKTVDQHGVTRVGYAGDRGSTPLLTLNGALDRIAVSIPKELRRRTPTGEVSDWLYLPPAGADPKPPLVVAPYPGYAPSSAPWNGRLDELTYTVNIQRLAAEGFAVLAPGLPARSAGGEPAAAIVQEVGEAIERGRASGLVDPDRVAVVGHSYGGYAALLSAARCPGLAAVVAAAAPTDLISEHGSFAALSVLDPHASALRDLGTGWSEGGQGALETTPQADPLRYVRNSPLFSAARIRPPVLLLYGEEDLVGVAQGEEMFSALKRSDHDARLMIFAGEDHTLTSPANLKAADAAITGFLKTAFLKKGSPPNCETTNDAPTPRPRPGP